MYPVVNIPETINQNFENMDGEDAATYFDWFMSIKGKRYECFISNVILANNKNLNDDFLLRFIFGELKKQIWNTKFGSAYRTDSNIYSSCIFLSPLAYRGVPVETTSYILDLGIFLGEIMIEKYPDDLSWSYINEDGFIHSWIPSVIGKENPTFIFNSIKGVNVSVAVDLIIKRTVLKHKKLDELVFKKYVDRKLKVFD